jgi:hypothetical protein
VLSDRLKKYEGRDIGLVQIELLDRMAETLDALMPDGVVDVLTFRVSDKLQKYTPPAPLFAIDFENTGPDTVYITVNRRNTNERPVTAGSGYYVFMGGRRIRDIYLRCDSGGSATVSADTVR